MFSIRSLARVSVLNINVLYFWLNNFGGGGGEIKMIRENFTAEQNTTNTNKEVNNSYKEIKTIKISNST